MNIRQRTRNTLIRALQQLKQAGTGSEELLSQAEIEGVITDLREGVCIQAVLSGGIVQDAGSDSLLGQLVGFEVVDFDVEGEDGNSIAVDRDGVDRDRMVWVYPVVIRSGEIYDLREPVAEKAAAG
jgi:hypothetical protein